MGWLKTLQEMISSDKSAGITPMDCPVCRGTPLRQTRLGDFGNVTLDICPTCHGVWFEVGELDRLDGSPWANVEEHHFHETEGDHPEADCPKCAVLLTPLSPADMPDVIVDRCSQCHGFWLDHGELDRMKEVAQNLDASAAPVSGDQKPAGWSDLRWNIYRLKATRD